MHSFCAVRLPNSLLLSPLDTQSNEKIIQNLELYTAIHQLTVMYLALKCPFFVDFFCAGSAYCCVSPAVVQIPNSHICCKIN